MCSLLTQIYKQNLANSIYELPYEYSTIVPIAVKGCKTHLYERKFTNVKKQSNNLFIPVKGNRL